MWRLLSCKLLAAVWRRLRTTQHLEATSCLLVLQFNYVRTSPFIPFFLSDEVYGVVFLTVFMFLGAEFFTRLVKNRPLRQVTNAQTIEEKSNSTLELKTTSWATLSPRMKYFIYGAIVSCICLFIR